MSFLENNIGLTGSVLSLFRTYLSGRSQCVSVNGVMSEFCHLAFGVPQGSVLGPLIFCTYLLPLGSILQHHKLDYHIYADDTQVYCSTDLLNPQDDLKRITACVSDIRTWMIQNRLKINDDKTEFLILHSSHKEFTANLNFKIGQTLVKPSDTCRNLGVISDSHMKMENQIQSICRSVNFHLRSINSVRNSLTDEATVLLVHALITSKLDYCNSLLHGLPDKLINVFSAFRILLLELFHTRRSSSTLLLSCMSSIGCQLRCELDLSYCCWSINVCNRQHLRTCVSFFMRRKNPNMEFAAMNLSISTSLILRPKHMGTVPFASVVQGSGTSYH